MHVYNIVVGFKYSNKLHRGTADHVMKDKDGEHTL